ncbi:MAG: EamA family transporter [Candidatus Magasanikbacteria bacterium]
MSWLYLALIAAFLWAIVNLADKFIVDHEINDPVIDVGISGFLGFIVITIVSYLQIDTASTLISNKFWLPLLAGILYPISLIFYYSGIKREDVSRFIPLFGIIPVITAIAAFFLLGENFSWIVYVGILLTVFGAILISLKNPLKNWHKFKSGLAVMLGVASAIIIAVRSLIIKFSGFSMNYWTILFWLGIGGLTVIIILLITKFKQIKKYEHIDHLPLVGLIRAGAYLIYVKAITLGPVSLVVTAIKIKPLLVFLGSTAVSKYHPEIIHEKLDKKTILQKVFATTIIIAGVLLIKIYS